MTKTFFRYTGVNESEFLIMHGDNYVVNDGKVLQHTLNKWMKQYPDEEVCKFTIRTLPVPREASQVLMENSKKSLARDASGTPALKPTQKSSSALSNSKRPSNSSTPSVPNVSKKPKRRLNISKPVDKIIGS